MKEVKRSGWMVLALLFIFPSLGEAHMMTSASKPVTSSLGIYESHFAIPMFPGRMSLEGSKPVLLMLGETPRTTLTSAHLRREGWRSHADPFEGTKPVVRMMYQ